MLTCAAMLTHLCVGWDHRLCIWEVDTKVVGIGKQDSAATTGSAKTGGESCMVVAAAGERDRSVGRVVPVVDEVSLHSKPISALAASADFLFTGASSRPPRSPSARLVNVLSITNCGRSGRRVAGCDANELKAWARPIIVEPPAITAATGGTGDDGLVDVESDPDSDDREEEQVAETIAAETRSSVGVTADV